MDFIGKHSRQEIIDYIKEQQTIIRENSGSYDEVVENGDELVRRRVCHPTMKDLRWLEANGNISKAVIHASECLSPWHTSRIRTATGMMKIAWFMYLHPDAAANAPSEKDTEKRMLELVATWTYMSSMFVHAAAA